MRGRRCFGAVGTYSLCSSRHEYLAVLSATDHMLALGVELIVTMSYVQCNYEKKQEVTMRG